MPRPARTMGFAIASILVVLALSFACGDDKKGDGECCISHEECESGECRCLSPGCNNGYCEGGHRTEYSDLVTRLCVMTCTDRLDEDGNVTCEGWDETVYPAPR